jgi:hypothetical protein
VSPHNGPVVLEIKMKKEGLTEEQKKQIVIDQEEAKKNCKYCLLSIYLSVH